MKKKEVKQLEQLVASMQEDVDRLWQMKESCEKLGLPEAETDLYRARWAVAKKYKETIEQFLKGVKKDA